MPLVGSDKSAAAGNRHCVIYAVEKSGVTATRRLGSRYFLGKGEFGGARILNRQTKFPEAVEERADLFQWQLDVERGGQSLVKQYRRSQIAFAFSLFEHAIDQRSGQCAVFLFLEEFDEDRRVDDDHSLRPTRT